MALVAVGEAAGRRRTLTSGQGYDDGNRRPPRRRGAGGGPLPLAGPLPQCWQRCAHMGIKGLWKALAIITRPCSVLEAFGGETIGIDAYGWLHKAVLCCPEDILAGRHPKGFLSYLQHLTRMLQHNGIVPILVFDGANLPAKAATEAARREVRCAALAMGQAALATGDLQGAHAAFARAVDVTPALAHIFIAWLREQGTPFVVAPYEADAQLSYLFRQGIITGVIAEDSDMVPFGVGRVLAKMDRYGDGQLLDMQHFGSRFPGVSGNQLLTACILAGCDYIDSLPGVAMKTALTLVRDHATVDGVLQHLRSKNPAIAATYDDAFKTARMTFLHQRVWCQRSRGLVELTPLPAELAGVPPGLLDFLGPGIPGELATAIARASIDPTTLRAYTAAGALGGAGSSAVQAPASAPAAPALPVPVWSPAGGGMGAGPTAPVPPSTPVSHT